MVDVQVSGWGKRLFAGVASCGCYAWVVLVGACLGSTLAKTPDTITGKRAAEDKGAIKLAPVRQAALFERYDSRLDLWGRFWKNLEVGGFHSSRRANAIRLTDSEDSRRLLYRYQWESSAQEWDSGYLENQRFVYQILASISFYIHGDSFAVC